MIVSAALQSPGGATELGFHCSNPMDWSCLIFDLRRRFPAVPMPMEAANRDDHFTEAYLFLRRLLALAGRHAVSA